jgi:biotin carboxyl carrier protein
MIIGKEHLNRNKVTKDYKYREGSVMRKYIVTVNGKKYEVEVEEVGGAESQPVKSNEVKEVKQTVRNEAPQREVSKPGTVEGKNTIKAPMPGTILDIRIAEGQSIKKGDVMFILEAMKMENEIMAGEDGVVSA